MLALGCQIALKAADIGHVALPEHLHRLWVGRLQEEFFAQGDRERAAGMPISAMMNRHKAGKLADLQVKPACPHVHCTSVSVIVVYMTIAVLRYDNIIIVCLPTWQKFLLRRYCLGYM